MPLLGDLSVYPVTSRVVYRLINRLHHVRDPTRSVLHHAEDEHVARAALTFTFDLQLVRIPGLGPLQCVLVNALQEEVMQEPDVARTTRVQTVIQFQVVKEVLPLLPEAMSDVVPQSLNTGVVDTPGIYSGIRAGVN